MCVLFFYYTTAIKQRSPVAVLYLCPFQGPITSLQVSVLILVGSVHQQQSGKGRIEEHVFKVLCDFIFFLYLVDSLAGNKLSNFSLEFCRFFVFSLPVFHFPRALFCTLNVPWWWYLLPVETCSFYIDAIACLPSLKLWF